MVMFPRAATAMFLSTAIFTVNAGVWQVMRMRWKRSICDNHKNVYEQPLDHIPAHGTPVGEFTRVNVTGTFDNEGSVLVGPRPMPSVDKQSPEERQESLRGGYIVMTPFEENETKQIIMVNRGWVPVDAVKSRLQRVQYTGEGFKERTLNGVIRSEEVLNSWLFGTKTQNTEPQSRSNHNETWLAMRPYNIALAYYARRFGAQNVDAKVKDHGARHWHVEVVEDHSGEDQILKDKCAFPYRRTMSDITYVAVTPAIHGGYAAFWFICFFGSVYGLYRVHRSTKKDLLIKRIRDHTDAMHAEVRARNVGEFYKETERISAKTGQRAEVAMHTTLVGEGMKKETSSKESVEATLAIQEEHRKAFEEARRQALLAQEQGKLLKEAQQIPQSGEAPK